MKHLKSFNEDFEKYDDIKYDIEGVLCQLKDIGIEYEISNYLELIIIKINEPNSELDEIFLQLDELMSNKGYKSKLINKDSYIKYYLPLDSEYSMEYYIANSVKTSLLNGLNDLYRRVRD